MPEVDLLPQLRLGSRRRTVVVTVAALLVLGAVAGGAYRLLGFDLHLLPTTEGSSTPQPVPATAPPEPEPEPEEPAAGETKMVGRPIERWLAALAAEQGLGLLLAPGITGGKVTATFPAGTDWESRLQGVSRLHGLEIRREEGFLEVSLAAVQTAETQGPSGGADSQSPPAAVRPPSSLHGADPPRPPAKQHATRLLRLSHAKASELVAAIDKPLAAGGITAGFDAGTNTLLLGGPQAHLGDAMRLAEGLDIPRRRFLLEAHIVELARSARHEMGVQWTLESNDLGAIVNFPSRDNEGDGSSILVATSGSHSLRARLSALESMGRVRVISRPRIVVVEGKPASIEAVRIIRVRLPDQGAVVADAEDSVAVDGGRAFEEIAVGVTLQVEPSLQGEGNIVLRIAAESSTLGPPQPPDDIPEELSRRVEADVVVADGHTAVLGGMLRENSSRSGTGVPVLRSLPLVGPLFGRRSRERDVEELIVLVTPRLIS